MINFRKIEISDKKLYDQRKVGKSLCGCEMSFANLFLWGEQKIADVKGCLVFKSTFGRTFYPFPIGDGDVKGAIQEIMLDAEQREIELEITSIAEKDKQFIEENFPDRFEFFEKDGTFDYIYDIDDLANLAGKKYHKKRNHLAQFNKACPDYVVEPISKDNFAAVKEMVSRWYSERLAASPDSDFDYEMDFFESAISNFEELNLTGITLKCGQKIIAVTFASQMEEDVLDVHFEKAFNEIPGAYVAINNEFAKYVKENFPSIKYLDREEDMGLEGLRKAKESYYPHHLMRKYRAKLKK